MDGNKTAANLLQKARWVELPENKAVGLIIPAPNVEEMTSLRAFSTLLQLEYDSRDWVWVNVPNFEKLEVVLGKLKATSIQDLIQDATWSTPNKDGYRTGFFHKCKDAILCVGAMKSMCGEQQEVYFSSAETHLLDPKRDVKNKPEDNLFLCRVPQAVLIASFPDMRWEEYGKKIMPLNEIRERFKKADWSSPDSLEECRNRQISRMGVIVKRAMGEEDLIKVTFGKKTDVVEIAHTVELLAGLTLNFDKKKNRIELDPSQEAAVRALLRPSLPSLRIYHPDSKDRAL